MVQISPIEPSVLRWVIDESGYDDAGIAELVGVDQADIETWASGRAKAPRGKVSELLKKLKRSPDVVYLDRVPEAASLKAHFRSMKVGGGTIGLNPTEIQVVRKAHYIQFELSRMLLVNEAPRPDLPALEPSGDANELGARLRAWTLAGQAGTNGYTFEDWRRFVEAKLVFVLEIDIPRPKGWTDRADDDPSKLRGFSLPDVVAPMVVVCTDSKPAKSFTLFHELAHLTLGRDLRGIGACHVPRPARDRIERQCDSIAGAALVPPDSLRDFVDETELAEGQDLITPVANEFKVSLSAAAVAIENGLGLTGLYRRTFAGRHYRERNPQNTSQGGARGQNRPTKRLKTFGAGLVRTVMTHLAQGSTTETRVRRLFDVDGDEITTMAAMVGVDFAT